MFTKIFFVVILFTAYAANLLYFIIEIATMPSFLRKVKADSEGYEGMEAWKRCGKRATNRLARPALVNFLMMILIVNMFILAEYDYQQERSSYVFIIVWLVVWVTLAISLSIYYIVLFKRNGISKQCPKDLERGNFIQNYVRFKNIRAANTAEIMFSFFDEICFGLSCGVIACAISLMV